MQSILFIYLFIFVELFNSVLMKGTFAAINAIHCVLRSIVCCHMKNTFVNFKDSSLTYSRQNKDNNFKVKSTLNKYNPKVPCSFD